MLLDRKKIIEEVYGTCKSEVEIAEKFEMYPEEVLEILSEENIERCLGCDWWYDSFELVDDEYDEFSTDEDLTGYCYNCRHEMRLK